MNDWVLNYPEISGTSLSQAKSPRMSLWDRSQLSLPFVHITDSSIICSHYPSVIHPVEKSAITKFGFFILMSFFPAYFSESSCSIANNHRLALIASLINCLANVKICLVRQILLPKTSDSVKAMCRTSGTVVGPRMQIALCEVFDPVLRVTIILACQFDISVSKVQHIFHKVGNYL